VVSTKVGCGRFHGKYSRTPPALVMKRGFDDGTNSTSLRSPIHPQKYLHWCCRFADMRACDCPGRESNAVRGLILPIERTLSIGRPYAGFVERLRYDFLDTALRAGWDDRRHGPVVGGISEAQARRSVNYARAQGWLRKPFNVQAHGVKHAKER
jgi:hypothetical protein